MMKCPACGRQTVTSYQTGTVVCPSCGWGSDKPRPDDLHGGGSRRVKRLELSFAVILLLVLGSGAMIVGVYVLVFELFRVRPSLLNHLIVAASIVSYAAMGWLLQPTPDEETLHVMPSLRESQFRVLDKDDRRMLRVSMFLYPGRIVGVSVVLLLRRLRRGGRAER